MLKLRILLPAILIGFITPAIAQEVYRSTDADGNIVFSDQQTEGAETVVIDTPNIADPVAVPPPSAAPPPEPEPVVEKTREPAVTSQPEEKLVGYPRCRKKMRRKCRRYSYEYGP